MRTRILALLLFISLLAPLVPFERAGANPLITTETEKLRAADIPTPESVLGFVPGDDRKLASWNQVLAYFEALARASDRVQFETLGQSTMGQPFVMATISAPENLARLDEFKHVQELLADPRKLGSVGMRDRKAAELIKRGKTVVLITCGIHSTEVGSYLSSMLIAHRLASSNSPEIQNILRNTIILLVPSLNPDGVDIVKDWYDKSLGTPYEGTDPPELYHKYTGHDNNRDWYAFTQVETQITIDKIHNVWHPQIVHDIHQQGAFGARLFLPPYMPPVEPNVPKQIVAGYTELGEFMARQMRVAGFTGITTNSSYDAWSPARAYSHYHGGVRILSETASCKIATPITVKFDQLRKGEGYDPRNESETYGPLWRGGEWHLRDITRYMTTAAFFLLRHAAENREEWLSRFYEIGKEAVRPKSRGEVYGFKVRMSENTSHLLRILDRASVEYIWLRVGKEITIQGSQSHNFAESSYPSDTVVVPLAQPYGKFGSAVLEPQRYPDLRDVNGHPLSPYDVTAQTLPLLMGVSVEPVYAPFHPIWIRNAQVQHELGDCLLSGRKSIALYKSSVPSIDKGWTDWALSKSCEEYDEITDLDIRLGDLYPKVRTQDAAGPTGSSNLAEGKYAVIIIPDQPPATILNGYKPGTMPPEYTGGLGQSGVKALREFVEQGGTLVCLNRASIFAIEQFKLPIRDIVADMSEKEFFAPGSILRIELDTSNPIARGMPKESIAWVEDSPVFEVISSGSASDRGSSPTIREGSASEVAAANVRIIARYPANRNPLLSGWLLGEKRIRGKAALVEVTLGKGRIILFGFRPQYRGQSLATYPLFFNAISLR